ncbi:MAG: phenylalanyl-tRNA synthetase, beta subunit, partial [Actinomycetia bacterium]|nr:phenylalanyl-tRNA synthetase, beta subunit [Actinomycetes bacterium]
QTQTPTQTDTLPAEPYHVAALLIGDARPAGWRDPEPPGADFFAAKGALQGLLDTLRIPWAVEPAGSQPEPFLHPGRAASILIDGQAAGWLGEIHPTVAAQWDLRDTVAAFELDLDAAPLPPTALYEDVTSFPEVREDIAVIVPDHVSAAQLTATVLKAGAPLLARAEVFDVYRDPERIGEGNVSLALRLVYRARDRTLTDEEVAARRERIDAAIGRELDGRIRAS